jgi:iron complex transport system substrate-binding protein
MARCDLCVKKLRPIDVDRIDSHGLERPVDKSVISFRALWPSRAPYLVVGLLVAITASSCRGETGAVPAAAVRRVVALTPSATDVVIAAGGLDRLVGVDRYSDQPQVASLPRVGDFLTPNIEQIVRLAPDLVVLDELQSKAVEALRAARIATLVLPMHTIADVRTALSHVGSALGTPAQSSRVVDEIDRALVAVADRARGRPGPRPRALLIVDRELGGLGNMVAAGPGTFLDELARTIGADNVLATATARYPRISPEQVLEAQPTLILDAVHTASAERARRDWDGLAVPAVRSGGVHILSDRIFISPGPRLGEALTRLEQLVYE